MSAGPSSSNQIQQSLLNDQGGQNQKRSNGSEPRLTRSKSQYHYELDTLDEHVCTTLWRDISRIGHNLFIVLFPCYYGFRGQKGRQQQLEALRNWDLWGPLIFSIILGIVISDGVHDGSMFATVFGTLILGACLLTLNVLLLGGQINPFQALCLIGYCVFPLDVAAIASSLLQQFFGIKTVVLEFVIVVACIVWSSWASVPFVSEASPTKRKFLAVYPLLLMYIFVGYLILLYV